MHYSWHVEVSLRSLCCCRKLSLARNVKCETCQGKGTKSGRQYTCEVRRWLCGVLVNCTKSARRVYVPRGL